MKFISNKMKEYIFKYRYIPLLNKIKKLEKKKEELKNLLIHNVSDSKEYSNFKITYTNRCVINYTKFLEDSNLKVPENYKSYTNYILIYSK